MPRQIVSQDPMTVNAVPEKTYDSMIMSSFRARTNESGTKVQVQMQHQESATGDISGVEAYTIDIKDWDDQIAQSPKLVRAWNDINDVMGLAYDFYRLRDKVKEGQENGDDVSALIAARNDALTMLREDL